MPVKLLSAELTQRSDAKATGRTDEARVATILGNSFKVGSIEDGRKAAARSPANTRPSQLVTVPEAAGQLGLSARTVWDWLAQRRIECVKLGRAVRIRQTVIDQLIERGTIPAKVN